MQRPFGGDRVVIRGGKKMPHARAAIVVMIAEDPVHFDPARQQRRGHHIQRLVALHIAQDHRRLRQRFQSRQPVLDLVPHLVDVTDEYDRHVRPSFEPVLVAGGSAIWRQTHAVCKLGGDPNRRTSPG